MEGRLVNIITCLGSGLSHAGSFHNIEGLLPEGGAQERGAMETVWAVKLVHFKLVSWTMECWASGGVSGTLTSPNQAILSQSCVEAEGAQPRLDSECLEGCIYLQVDLRIHPGACSLALGREAGRVG